MAKQLPEAVTIERDLPALLDTLTTAVTTLDAVGVERYEQLYLYVIGETATNLVRDLRVENGHLIVGPPIEAGNDWSRQNWDEDVEERVQLLSQLHNIMRLWGWPTEKMATYLGCSPSILCCWTRSMSRVNAPVFPQSVMEKIRRLAMVDLARSLSGVTDREMPLWLENQRVGFGRRSISQLLESDDRSDFCQLLLWSLNSRQRRPTVH